MAKLKHKSRQYLLFIDTCVFLDFYRYEQANLDLLSRLDSITDEIITTSQVEMEFKKNRQRVIRESDKKLQVPANIVPPPCLRDVSHSRKLAESIAECSKRVKQIKTQLKNILLDPTHNDKVYKAAQRIFDNNSPYGLFRPNPLHYTIWRLARKRFALGYPPRKDEDTSCGDAINWEWIIHCAKESNKHIIIVSRDSDYGITLDGKGYLNDWLADEFRERTSPRRQIILTPSLADALRTMSVQISERQFLQEMELLGQQLAEEMNKLELAEEMNKRKSAMLGLPS